MLATRPGATAPRDPARLGDLGMLAVVLIWGLNFGVTKAAFETFPPLAFTAVRFAVASALLLPLVRRIEGEEPLPAGALGKLVILGLVGNTLYQLGFISGLALTTASNSAIILAAMPPVTAVAAAALGIEPVRPRVIAGVVVASIGVVLVVAADDRGTGGGRLAGDLLTLGAVLCWSGYTLGLRSLPAGVSPLRVTAVTTVAGLPGLALAGLPQLLATDWGAIGVRGWAALAYSTVFALLVAYLIWNRSVKMVGPSRTVLYMCLTPLVAAGGAAILLGERLRLLQGIGAVLILSGVLLARSSAGAADERAIPAEP